MGRGGLNLWKLFLLMLLLPCVALGGGEHESLARIEEVASTWAKAQASGPWKVEAEARALDPRLKLPRCQDNLGAQGFGKVGMGRVTVQVTCEGPSPWKIYVPVDVCAVARVLTLAHPVPRGKSIGPEDLNVEEKKVVQAPQAAPDPGKIQGWVAKHDLAQGEVLTEEKLRPPMLVRRGDLVTIFARAGTALVSAQAKALESGREGEWVSVRNQKSKRVVDAVVVGWGQVEVLPRSQ